MRMSNNEQREIIPFRKSNQLISSKVHNNLLTNKLYAIAMTRIETEGSKEGDKLVAKMYPGEIQELVGQNSNIYRELRLAAALMTGQSIGIEDGRGNFKFFSVVNEATYIGGVFKIEFNENIRPHIKDLTQNYTTLNLVTMTSFKKDVSFRIYEILKAAEYRIRGDVNDGKVTVTYYLNEFRFMIGVANIDEAGVQKYINRNKPNIDWDYLFETVCKEKKYENWYDFKRYVLVPAQKELKKTSDIAFDFDGVRVKGNKIGKIKIDIYKNVPTEDAASKAKKQKYIDAHKTKIEQLEFPDMPAFSDLMEKYKNHAYLREDDVKYLLQIAGYNKELVEEAIAIADKTPESSAVNYISWIENYIVSCLKTEKMMQIIDVLPEKLTEYVGHNELTTENLNTLYNKAEGDISLVINGIEAADKQDEVRNYMGWIIAYIERGGYAEPIETLKGSASQAKRVKKIMKEYEENKASIAEKVWNSQKTKEEYPLFEEYLAQNGMSTEIIEDLLSSEERVQMFFDWKRGNK